MTGLHAVPSAADLLAACIAEVRQEIRSGHGSYSLRVVAATLEIVERELRAGVEPDRLHLDRLRALGFEDEAELARAIRQGVIDDDLDEVRDAVIADVLARLEVVNADYVKDYS